MATVSISLTLDDAYVPAFRQYLAAQHPAADTNGDENVTGPEAVAWVQSKCQEILDTFAVERAMPWAEENAPESLPQAHQDAIETKAAAEAALRAERVKITAG